MTNPKGTLAETAFVKWARANGFPGAERKPRYGHRDQGDINLCPGLVAEIKNYRLPTTGTPPDAQLTASLAQAATEKTNADARYCPLIVKRPGTTDVGRWFAYLPASDLALLTGAYLPVELDSEPVMVTVNALAVLLRSCGYGTPTGTTGEEQTA